MHRLLRVRIVAQAATTALFCFVLVFVASPSRAAEGGKVFTKGPYLQAPGQSTMTVMWESTVNGGGVVHYGLEGKLDQAAKSRAPKAMTGVSGQFYLYLATLEGLKPGTTYSYSVEQPGARTAAKQFRTFAQKPEKVTFIGYGDTRSNPDIHADLAKWFKLQARLYSAYRRLGCQRQAVRLVGKRGRRRGRRNNRRYQNKKPSDSCERRAG